jgi:hypothetical protein
MDGKNRMEQTYSRIYKNGEFTGLHGTMEKLEKIENGGQMEI